MGPISGPNGGTGGKSRATARIAFTGRSSPGGSRSGNYNFRVNGHQRETPSIRPTHHSDGSVTGALPAVMARPPESVWSEDGFKLYHAYAPPLTNLCNQEDVTRNKKVLEGLPRVQVLHFCTI
jgi:hypothetical protein